MACMQGIIAVLVQIFFAWRLGALTKSWTLVVVVCLGSISGGGKSTSLLESYYPVHITIPFSAGAIATAFEVGHTPHFVEFRNFKVGPKKSLLVTY